MKQKLVILCAVLVLFSGAIALFAVSNQSSRQANAANAAATVTPTVVTISQSTFTPKIVTIKVGMSVIWKNMDPIAHTVTSNDGVLFNHTIRAGGSYKFTFTTAAKVHYHCAIHPTMVGTVVVKSISTTTPTATPKPTKTPTPTPTSTPGSTTTVNISHYTYIPSSLTIAVGTTIIWKNLDSVGHTITSDDGTTFDHVIAAGGTYKFTFTKAGSFPYHCNFHSFMTATITVQ